MYNLSSKCQIKACRVVNDDTTEQSSKLSATLTTVSNKRLFIKTLAYKLFGIKKAINRRDGGRVSIWAFKGKLSLLYYAVKQC